MALDFEAWVAERMAQVNAALDRACPIDGTRLREAMRYSLLAGGKRIRPLLCLAAAEAVGGDPNEALPAAVAVEMIHTFSLIHDDLPAMDDDDLRRGLPTCHKKFDEATAILAGDALQAMAFMVISHAKHRTIDAIRALSFACEEMCSGQVADLQAQAKQISLKELQNIHGSKTGILIWTSISLGAMTSSVTEQQPLKLTQNLKILLGYGSRIGVAFQIVDDILDVTGTDESLGKPANSDLKHDKATYPKLVGLDESRRLAREALADALGAIEPLGEPAEPLRQIARWIVERNV